MVGIIRTVKIYSKLNFRSSNKISITYETSIDRKEQ